MEEWRTGETCPQVAMLELYGGTVHISLQNNPMWIAPQGRQSWMQTFCGSVKNPME